VKDFPTCVLLVHNVALGESEEAIVALTLSRRLHRFRLLHALHDSQVCGEKQSVPPHHNGNSSWSRTKMGVASHRAGYSHQARTMMIESRVARKTQKRKSWKSYILRRATHSNGGDTLVCPFGDALVILSSNYLRRIGLRTYGHDVYARPWR